MAAVGPQPTVLSDCDYRPQPRGLGLTPEGSQGKDGRLPVPNKRQKLGQTKSLSSVRDTQPGHYSFRC